MTMEDFCTTADIGVEIEYIPARQSWSADLKYAEISDQMILRGTNGFGHSPIDAINPCIDSIRSQKLIIHASGGPEKRRTVFVPKSLENMKL